MSRARMFMRRDLAWTAGYPVGGKRWRALPPNAAELCCDVDGQSLSRARRTLNFLLRDFPRALPRIVGDTQRWHAVHCALFDLVKPVASGRGPLPELPLEVHPFASSSLLKQSRSLRKAHSELRPFCDAFEWMGWTDPTSLAGSLRWLGDHATEVGGLAERLGAEAVPLVVRLHQLTSRHGERRAGPVLAFLANDAVWQGPLERTPEYMARAAQALEEDRRPPPEIPAATLPGRLVAWVHELAAAKANTQRSTLDLFGLVVDTRIADDWPAWWVRVEQAIERSRQASAAAAVDRMEGVQRSGAMKLRARCRSAPPALPANLLCHVLRDLTAAPQLELCRVVLKALGQWPDRRAGLPIRLVFAAHWLDTFISEGPEARPMLLRSIAAQTAYLQRRGFSEDSLQPWNGVWSRFDEGATNSYALDFEILDCLTDRKQLATFFETLEGMTAPVSSSQAELLAQLSGLLDADRVAPAFTLLAPTKIPDECAPNWSVRAAARLTTEAPERLPAILSKLIDAGDNDTGLERALSVAFDVFEASGRTEVLLDAIESGGLGPIREAAHQVEMLREAGEVPPLPEPGGAVEGRLDGGLPSWAERYPTALHDELRHLVAHDHSAQAIARRILDKTFPDPEATERELAVLCSLPAPSRAQLARISNLEKRSGEQAPSVRRLEKLARKLRRAADRRLLEGWIECVDRRFREVLLRQLGHSVAPEWLDSSDVKRALAHVAALDRNTRALVQRLLLARVGEPPWDLRDDPRNRAFLERMRARGIDCRPWLEAAEPERFDWGERRSVYLGIERDPLEVFQMGWHFGTCLAPGAFNYFSVFSNAADVNKQVVFARDEGGSVAARILLALTDDGGVVAFHPYSHSHRTDFAEMASEFAHRLASAMNTRVVREGPVSKLVSHDWYDDGPEDLTRQIPALVDGSPLRTRLPEMPGHEAIRAFEAAFDPLPLNELTIPLIVGLPEFIDAPQLARALVSRLHRVQLPAEATKAIARVLVDADEESAAAPLASLLANAALRAYRPWGEVDYEACMLLASVAPSRALSVLRRTRPRGVRRLRDERDPTRLQIAKEAYSMLRR